MSREMQAIEPRLDVELTKDRRGVLEDGGVREYDVVDAVIRVDKSHGIFNLTGNGGISRIFEDVDKPLETYKFSYRKTSVETQVLDLDKLILGHRAGLGGGSKYNFTSLVFNSSYDQEIPLIPKAIQGFSQLTALHLAVIAGNKDVAKFIATENPNLLSKGVHTMHEPEYPVANGNMLMAGALVVAASMAMMATSDRDKMLEIVGSPKEKLKSPLPVDFAAALGQEDMVEMLISKGSRKPDEQLLELMQPYNPMTHGMDGREKNSGRGAPISEDSVSIASSVSRASKPKSFKEHAQEGRAGCCVIL